MTKKKEKKERNVIPNDSNISKAGKKKIIIIRSYGRSGEGGEGIKSFSRV